MDIHNLDILSRNSTFYKCTYKSFISNNIPSVSTILSVVNEKSNFCNNFINIIDASNIAIF